MLARMFDRRCRGYEASAITSCCTASAVLGWPVEVALPLIRNGKRITPPYSPAYSDGVYTPWQTCLSTPPALRHRRRGAGPPERQRSVSVSPVGNNAGNRRLFSV